VSASTGLYPVRTLKFTCCFVVHYSDWCISRQLWWGHRIPAYHVHHNVVCISMRTDDVLCLCLCLKNYRYVTLSADHDIVMMR